MKTCTKCKQPKPFTEFNKRASKPDGLQVQCKECCRAQARDFYKRNPEPYKKRAKARKKQVYKTHRKLIDSIKQKYGCALCEEKELCCLDFHHFKKKSFNITQAASKGRKVLQDEINKCVVVCANCHRKIHAKKKKVSEDMLCHETFA